MEDKSMRKEIREIVKHKNELKKMEIDNNRNTIDKMDIDDIDDDNNNNINNEKLEEKIEDNDNNNNNNNNDNENKDKVLFEWQKIVKIVGNDKKDVYAYGIMYMHTENKPERYSIVILKVNKKFDDENNDILTYTGLNEFKFCNMLSENKYLSIATILTEYVKEIESNKNLPKFGKENFIRHKDKYLF